ncbi:sporulation protein YunB [Alicyclobacillus fastidiosus]|uniref:Sporulation protein YunB n=1 Tax=Alicyclobacillus fastidiosus TaxID=392011 RepID=A0ABV5AIN3_9BACL|nr:sporulation protein YunB [Alicyclobacillus fastidiosus]WEH11192.1 sporulation protein YunB [Alicyclobacillus fastidiosus]
MAQRFRSRPSPTRRLRIRRYRIVRASWGLRALIALCIVTLGAFFLDMKLRPVVTTASAALAHRVGAQALGEALTEEISSFPEDDKLVETSLQKENGGITVTRLNLSLLTTLQGQATARAQSHLEDLSKQTIRLPVMHVLSGSLLSRSTLTIPVKISILGTAHSTIETEVETKGVNQVVHIVYLHLTADVMVLTPFVSSPTVIETRAPIAYLVMNGPVPNAYYGTGSTDRSYPPSSTAKAKP